MGLFEERLSRRLEDPEFAAGYAEADRELHGYWTFSGTAQVLVSGFREPTMQVGSVSFAFTPFELVSSGSEATVEVVDGAVVSA